MRGRSLTLLLFLVTAVAYLTLLALPVSWWQERLKIGHGPSVFVMVEPGMNARDAARHFVREGITSEAQALSRWLTTFGIDRSLKPGVYFLRPGSPWEVAKQLVNVEPRVFSVVLVPGSDVDAFAHSLGAAVASFWEDVSSSDLSERHFSTSRDTHVGESGEMYTVPVTDSRSPGFIVTSADLLVALADETHFPEPLRKMLPENPSERFAFLLPETFVLPPSPSLTASLVRQASSLWWRAFASDVAEKSAAEMRSLATLASIIEKEIRKEEERPIAAGVFRNRLERKMPLQSCATVVYAWKLKGRILRTLTYEDLKVESPFNTYLHPGLPPGPICVPSQNSWSAALHPEEHDLLYFVADNKGGHVFSRSYKEHLDAQRKIRNENR
ncbi:endolytic transglycosylase MltG [Aminiphilus sp.]|jgi:UPF0755 protein|uniref:endolytic transglycosylase MltG n=1 Tax=Aminiphilus sp. TaxID=1872488 RepID=UPI00263323BD|nr:endolytic transglycosylase MltG [Aminiphilus sp.]